MAEIAGANLIGSNVVYDTSKPVNQYLVNVQRQEAKRLAEQKALQDDLSKVKIDGVRDPDRNEYIQKYTEWKGMSGAINKERDPIKKAYLKSEFDKKYLELEDLISDSKKLAKGEEALSTIFMDPVKRDNFADDAVTRFQKSKTLSRKDPNYIRDLTAFERKLDLSKIDEDLRNVDKEILGSTKWGNPQEVAGQQGNRKGVYVSQSRVVDPVAQAERYSMQYDVNPNLRAFLRQHYPNLNKEQAIAELVKQRPVREDAKPEFKENDNWREKANYQDWLIGRRAAKTQDEETLYRQRLIDGMVNKVPGSGEKLNAILSAIPGFEGKQINYSFDGNTMDVNIPQRRETKVKIKDGETVSEIEVTPPRTVRLDLTKPESKDKLNQLINDLTGEKISNSKFQTGQASGKIKGATVSDKSAKTVTFVMPNGQTGEIPSDKVSAFIKKYPKAKRK